MLLATDLDGTFLAGAAADRLQLYRLINTHPDIQLVYVTGRGLEAVLPLLSDPTLPQPDYVICDVGATIVHGSTLQPVQPVQQQIATRWPGEAAVMEALAGVPGLLRQDVPQERRCSFFGPEALMTDDLRARVEALGCELLHSADRYLDVLPRGVHKGGTLSGLVQHLGLSEDEVLVAGDTLNDLSMYDAGFKGVCVGASEARLLAATRQRARVLHAQKPGCGGILEAITHFGFLGDQGLQHHGAAALHPGSADLLIVYHRLPYDESLENGELKRRRPASPNGIIPTLLSFFADGRRGSWVAWSVHDAKSKSGFDEYTQVDGERYPNLTVSRVPLSKSDVDVFYKSFSKEAFWPTLHTFWERARFREDHWRIFVKVNRAFAERIAREAATGATVWLHDYNLWMVPAALRELRPDLNLAFFHHTHFPSADVFNVIPWRRAIVASLLQCDYVGFHIPRQVENFVDVARGTLPVETVEERSAAPRFLTYGCGVGLDRYTTCIDTGQRRVHLGAHPVGLDMQRVEALLSRADVQQQMATLREQLKGTRVLLSVERLDYTKGILERLQAFEHLLDQHPELIGKVSLVTICVPAAREMTIYRTLQNQIEQAVGRINGRHSRVGWMPVQFFFRSLPFEELLAYYAMADLMWITPLRDGLNLVAKEFVAVQGLTGGSGVLVLSEFAGAAAELKGAVLTNPHDPEDLVSACYYALSLGRAEARSRLRQLFDIVSYHDNRRWGEEFLEAAQAAASGIPAPAQPSAA